MNRMAKWAVTVGMLVGVPAVWAHEEHGGAAGDSAGEQTLTGEVIDVFCYLSHGAQGQGKDHAGCAKKCIESGLPVAIRSGGTLYLATMADHSSANAKLAGLAGHEVTVRGKILEADGQHLIAVEEIQH